MDFMISKRHEVDTQSETWQENKILLQTLEEISQTTYRF